MDVNYIFKGKRKSWHLANIWLIDRPKLYGYMVCANCHQISNIRPSLDFVTADIIPNWSFFSLAFFFSLTFLFIFFWSKRTTTWTSRRGRGRNWTLRVYSNRRWLWGDWLQRLVDHSNLFNYLLFWMNF